MSDELIEQLRDDIRTLIDNLTDPRVLDVSRVRSVSTSICRRWLIDKGLVTLARDLLVTPSLPTFENSRHIRLIEKWRAVSFYTTGGISLGGFPINSVFDLSAGFPGHVELPVLRQKALTPSKFLSRKCSYVDGVWFKAEDILRYMANKAGGVHYDQKREKVIDQRIDEARQCYSIVSESNAQIDRTKRYIEIALDFQEEIDFCYLEMMSIAQSLCNVRFNGQSVVHKMRVGEDNTGFGNDILLGHTHHMRVDL